MSCFFCNQIPEYKPHSEGGIKLAISKGDGYTIGIDWTQSFTSDYTYNLAYNIYYSSLYNDLFKEGPKLVCINKDQVNTLLSNFEPGDLFYFAVRASQSLSTWFNLSLLPDDITNNLKYYPESVILQDISLNDNVIYISDIDIFPAYGVVKIESELIAYSSKDLSNNTLIISERGFLGTEANLHLIDGYSDPIVRFWEGCEEKNEVIAQAQSTFHYPNFAFTEFDGYKKIEPDLLSTDLSASDANTIGFRGYDYRGWHRVDPTILFKGGCVGSYYSGEMYCADGYNAVGVKIRGIPFNERSHQREEMLLENGDGEECVLLQRTREGIPCTCFDPIRQHPNNRCEFCYGSGFVVGYKQYFNPRISTGRILVRFGPTQDYAELQEAGLESTFIPECWTLVVPTVKDRDHLIRFNEDGTQEFRYEIKKVTRNRLLFGQMGAQKFEAHRIRKYDTINQVPAFYNTAKFPTKITTGIGYLKGPNGLIPHVHTLVINEGITDVSQINQLTSIDSWHNHIVRDGKILPVIGNQSVADGAWHDGHVHGIIL